jgi:hypothetical protein
MSINKVKFQKGLSLPEFYANYGTEEQCFQVAFRLKWPRGFVCPACGNSTYCRVHKKRVLQCNGCHSQTSVTARTIFHSSNLPLSKWFLSIYLITQEKNGISALELSRQIGFSYKSAWRLKHKLMQAMKEQEDQDTLKGRVEVDDAYLGGRNKGGKRGRGFQYKLPFFAAVQTSDGKHPQKIKLRAVTGFTKQQAKQFSKKFISDPCLLVTDGLACFNAMSGGVHIHQKMIAYDNGKYIEHHDFKWVNTVLGNLKNALVSTYKANRKKYAQRYLSEFEYRLNRRFDLKEIFTNLLRDSLSTPAIPVHQLCMADNST